MDVGFANADGGGFGDIIYEHVEAVLSELRSGGKSELPTPPC